MKKISLDFRTTYPYAIILVFSLIYVARLFYSDYQFYGEEQGFLNYDYINFRHTYIWDWSHNFGNIFAAGVLNLFTNGLFWRLFRIFHVPFLYIQQTYFFSIIFFTTLFTYLACNQLTKNKILSLTTAFVYITTYHYYAIIITTPKILHFLVLPVSIFFYLKYVQTKNTRYVIFNTIALLLLLGLGANPPQLLGAYSFIFIYLIVFGLHTRNIKSLIIFVAPFIINILFVFSLNYIELIYHYNINEVDPFSITWYATGSRVYEILRMFGGWWDYAGSGGIAYNHLLNYYHSRLGILISYLPVLTLVYVFLQAKNKSTKINVMIIFLTLILLVKGSGIPFNFVFNFFFSIRFFKIFREPWAKFMPTYIFFVYFGLLHLIENKRTLKLIFVMLAVVLIFQIIPLLQGNIIDHRNIDWKLTDVKVPHYWIDLMDWSRTKYKDKRILVLPISLDDNYPVIHNWQLYPYRGHPEEFFLYANILNNYYINSAERPLMTDYFSSMSNNLFKVSSIDYVLDQTDAATKASNALRLAAVANAIDKKNKISFGQIDLYPVKPQSHLSKIRSISHIITTYKPCNNELFSNTTFDFKQTAIIKSVRNFARQNLQETEVISQQISPTKYMIELKGSPYKDMALLFAQNYNPGWKLMDASGVFAHTISEDAHYQANCFSNLWIIKKSARLKSNQIIYLEFTPERTFIFILLTYFAITITYIVVVAIYRKRQIS